MKRKASFPDFPEEIKMEILPKIPTYFSDIPEDIQMEIPVKFPAYFLWENFRCVSKAWYEVISSSYYSYKHNAVHKISAGILIQVPYDDKNTRERLFYTKFNTYFLEIAENGFDMKSNRFGQTPMGYISSSYNGLILETVFPPNRYSSVLHVKNNLTRFDITIPNSLSGCKHVPSDCLLKLGFNPDTKEYKLVHIVYEQRRYEFGLKFELFAIGVDKAWRTIPAGSSMGLVDRWTKVVCVGGKFLHWLHENYINSMDIWDEKFSKIKLPCIGCSSYLIEIDGKLAVGCSRNMTEIKIWFLTDFSTGIWSNEYTIRAKCTNYITLKGHVCSNLPSFLYLQAITTLNNGEKILFWHTGFERKLMVYLYDIKLREMRKFKIINKSAKLFIPHHISLVRL